MPKRLNSLSSLLRLFISQYDLSRKHLFIMLFMPIVLAMASSYVVTNYLVDKKAQEVGEFNLKRLEHLLSQSETIGEYATTLSEGDCSALNEYMRFKPYYRGVLLFNAHGFHCSSANGVIDYPLNSLLPEATLKKPAYFIVPETPARTGVPAILVISTQDNLTRGAVVIIEGQYLIDSFIQPEVFPRPVNHVVLGLKGATLPTVPQFGDGKVVAVRAEHSEFVILLEVSQAFFWHFFWICFGITLPFLLAFVWLVGLHIWRKKSRSSLADDIKSGIENQEFFLVYQPIVSSVDGKAKGVEALVRWQHPQMGLVRPDLFIPIAEQSQLIVPLTNYIFERALADFSQLSVDSGFRIGFNVAPEHFIQSDIEAKFRYLKDAFARIGVQPLIEITERQLLTADMCERITALRELDILVAIDDFGTGQTTLSLLQTFTLDYLKIDKCFIDTIGQDSVTSHVLDTIIELCHKMNYVAVAEGVETQQQADYLISRDVHFLQGYLFAKPMKLDELSHWLEAHS